MTSSPSKLRRREDWSVESFEDGFVLYDPSAERVIEFNATAALIWQLCDGTRSMDEIKKVLVDAYPESAKDVERDVEATVALMLEKNCLAP